MQTKLTIAIPTYNRASYLDKLLDSIFKQYEKYFFDIDVIVIDNCSTDNTQHVVEKYMQPKRNLCYWKQSKNMGLDYNIYSAFMAAKGKFVWILGDDELLFENALDAIMNLLNNNYDCSLISFNGVPYYNEEDIQTAEVSSKLSLITTENKVTFAKIVNIYFTFISGNIINKDFIVKNTKDIDFVKKYLGTDLTLLTWTFYLLKYGKKFIYIKNKIFYSKVGNNGGYKFFEVFAHRMNDIAAQELGELPKVYKALTVAIISLFMPIHILEYRQMKLQRFCHEEGIKSLLMKTYSKHMSFWFFSYPVFIFPIYFAKIYVFLNRAILKILRLIRNGIYQLSNH